MIKLKYKLSEGLFMKKIILVCLFLLNCTAFADNLKCIVCESNKGYAKPTPFSEYYGNEPAIIHQQITAIFYLDIVNKKMYITHYKDPVEVIGFNDKYITAKFENATFGIDRISGEFKMELNGKKFHTSYIGSCHKQDVPKF